MTLRTLRAGDVASGSQSAGFALYVDPAIPAASLPTVWVDLHIGGGGWQYCEEHDRWRPFKPDVEKRSYTVLRPGRGVRLTTEERIGTDAHHSAIVVNVASQASRGLIVAAGKVDPGFNPAPLGVVVYNQSRLPLRVHQGDKIAALAFAVLDGAARATQSVGYGSAHAPSATGDLRWNQRASSWLSRRNWGSVISKAFEIVLAAALSLLVIWIAYTHGWKP